MHDNSASMVYEREPRFGRAYMAQIERDQKEGSAFVAILHSAGFMIARPGWYEIETLYKVKYDYRRASGAIDRNCTDTVSVDALARMEQDTRHYRILDKKGKTTKVWRGMTKGRMAQFEKEIERMRLRKPLRRGDFYRGPALLEVARSDGRTTTYESYG